MACPGSFLFGQRHAGGRDAPSDARDARLPGVCGLNGVLLPDARGSSPSVLCASCARLPAALVARELLVAVDLSKLISSERDGGDLLARMDRAESAWLNLLGRRLHGYPQADAGKIAGDESKSSTERIHSAESAVLAGRWTPALFAHLARKLADETETEREFWVLSPSERVGKDVVVLVFLNAVRLHQWKRSFKLWAGQAAADEAITNLDEPFLPLYPCPITGISTQKPTASAPAASAASTEPSFDPLVLHDSATRLSILLHALAGVPVSPTSTREILQLLVIWLDVWYAAVVDKAIVPITKTGSVVQGGGLVGNGDTEEDDEPDEFFPSSATNERDGLAVGTVICAVALLLKGSSSFQGS